jgi:hypothetical protein
MKYILSCILGLLLIAAIGCGGSTPAANPTAAPTKVPPTNAPATIAPAPTNTPAPTKAVAPTNAQASGGGNVKPPEGAPLDVVKKSLLSVFESDSVRAKTVLMPAEGESQTLLLEYVKPDRMRIVQPDGTEQIAIKGKGIWKKEGDTWEGEGPEMANMLFGFIEASAVQESLKSIQIDSVQLVGPDLLEGKPMFVYTYKTQVDMGGTKNNGVGKIWIGALDGRPYKGDSESDSIASPGKTDRTQVTYEYDLPLEIQAPQ